MPRQQIAINFMAILFTGLVVYGVNWVVDITLLDAGDDRIVISEILLALLFTWILVFTFRPTRDQDPSTSSDGT